MKHRLRITHISLALVCVFAVSCAEAPTIQMLEVKEHKMRVQTAGMHHSNRGQPTVVFESGAGDSLEIWKTVVQGVAEFAPAIAYDRSGIGQSQWDGQRPTPQHVAENLHVLLERIGAKPPYVLVGHSLGGIFIRMFAGLYPHDVAGLVYVEGGPIPSEKEEFALYETLGIPTKDLTVHRNRVRQEFAESIALVPAGAPRAELEVFKEMRWDTYFADFQSLPPVPDVPVAALVAAKLNPVIYRHYPCEPEECIARNLSVTMGWFSRLALAVPDGILVLSGKSGHNIQNDDPEIVISAIRRVVSSTKKRP